MEPMTVIEQRVEITNQLTFWRAKIQQAETAVYGTRKKAEKTAAIAAWEAARIELAEWERKDVAWKLAADNRSMGKV